MKRTQEEMVSHGLEITPKLLPFVTELLADIDELGSDSDEITNVVKRLGLSKKARVIDLGCGKGSTAIKIAKELGYKVHGIELHRPFVEICRTNAHKAKVDDLCSFNFGDITKYAEGKEPYDIAIFAAIGDSLGTLEETVSFIRRYVKPGGFLVISDVYLKEGSLATHPDFSYIVSKDEMTKKLAIHGDTVKSIYDDFSDDEMEADEEQNAIVLRANKLAEKHPELKEELLSFAKSQSEENVFIEENTSDAIWVIQKADK